MDKKCNVCGKEDERVYEGYCPECKQKLEGMSCYSTYMATFIGLGLAAIDIQNRNASNNLMTLGDTIWCLFIWIIVAFFLYVIASVIVDFAFRKSKTSVFVRMAIIAAIIVLLGYTPKEKMVYRPSYSQLEQEYEMLESEYDDLYGDTVNISESYYYLLEELRDLQSDMEWGYDYELDEFADRLDSIIYDYE